MQLIKQLLAEISDATNIKPMYPLPDVSQEQGGEPVDDTKDELEISLNDDHLYADSAEDHQEQEQDQDPNRAGVIRKVNGAHLVYKREQQDGTFEEMWIFNTTDIKQTMKTRSAILSGTDIKHGRSQSDDGSQSALTWSIGNADVLVITGLQR